MTNREQLEKLIHNATNEQIFSILTHDIEKIEDLFGHRLPLWGNDSQFDRWCRDDYGSEMKMKDNFINIKLDNTEDRALVGEELGKKIYEEQIKGKLDFNKDFGIYFPDNIETCTTSFVIGLFKQIKDEIGYIRLKDKLKTNLYIILDKIILID